MKNTRDIIFALSLTAIYAVFVIWLSGFHELWRDEVVVVSVVKDADSLPALYQILRNFGHPGLWQTILYFIYQIFPTYLILPVTNLLVCTAAVFLFLAFAPFDRIFKSFFILGALPLYVYPIINRSYGLGMLMIFVVCALYPKRWSHFMWFALTVGLMANTHAHLLLIAGALSLSLLVEGVVWEDVRRHIFEHRASIVCGSLIILAFFALTAYQIMPVQDSIIFAPKDLSLEKIVKATVKSIVLPGKNFPEIFGIQSTLFVNAIILAFYLFLLTRINLLVLFAASVIGLSMFLELIYQSRGLRHEGALYMLMIMVLWMRRTYEEPPAASGVLYSVNRYFQTHMNSFFAVIMLIHISMGYVLIKSDIRESYSSAKSFAEFIKLNAQFKDALIMGEPDGVLETLPYYMDNPIYFSRARKFGTYRKFSRTEDMEMDFDKLLSSAQRIQAENGKDVLILLGVELASQDKEVHHHAFGKTFRFSADDHELFEDATELVATFDGAIINENYLVYRLIPEDRTQLTKTKEEKNDQQ